MLREACAVHISAFVNGVSECARAVSGAQRLFLQVLPRQLYGSAVRYWLRQSGICGEGLMQQLWRGVVEVGVRHVGARVGGRWPSPRTPARAAAALTARTWPRRCRAPSCTSTATTWRPSCGECADGRPCSHSTPRLPAPSGAGASAHAACLQHMGRVESLGTIRGCGAALLTLPPRITDPRMYWPVSRRQRGGLDALLRLRQGVRAGSGVAADVADGRRGGHRVLPPLRAQRNRRAHVHAAAHVQGAPPGLPRVSPPRRLLLRVFLRGWCHATARA